MKLTLKSLIALMQSFEDAYGRWLAEHLCQADMARTAVPQATYEPCGRRFAITRYMLATCMSGADKCQECMHRHVARSL